MAQLTLPSPDVLRQLLRYDPETGKLFWRHRGDEWFNAKRDAIRWNAKHAGKEAFISVRPQGYRVGQIYRVTIRAHRAIWAVWHGSWPSQAIDHIDGNPANNRIANLRDVPQILNNQNAARRVDNTSGFVGVRWHKANSNWVVTVGNEYIGTFNAMDAAIAARVEAARSRGFHENHGRVHL